MARAARCASSPALRRDANSLKLAYAAGEFLLLRARDQVSSCASADARDFADAAVFSLPVEESDAPEAPDASEAFAKIEIENESDRAAAANTTAAPLHRYSVFIAVELVPQDRRRIRVLPEGFRITVSQNGHRVIVEVIHGMIEDSFKSAIVFLA